jgi:Flp pilus assembly protein TadG
MRSVVTRIVRRGSRPVGCQATGQALVELALILPILFVLLAVALDLGRLFYSTVSVTNAAREGALEAAANPVSYQAGQPCDKVTNRVTCRAINESHDSFVTIAPADVRMACSPACTAAIGNSVSVTVTGHFALLTPLLSTFLGGTDLTLSSTASAQVVTPPTAAAPTEASPSPTATPVSTATPLPTPTPDPSASPTESPSPSPTPYCVPPTASFTVDPTHGARYKNSNFPGTTFTFTDTTANMTAPGCNPVWSWNFGDGLGKSSLQNPTYVYGSSNDDPGFLVTLVASNLGGKSTYTVRVVVTR